jgi:hypothetical protein
MIGILERFILIIAIGVISAAATYIIYRKSSAVFWGYIAVWPLEFPAAAAAITGAQNLQHFDLFMHAFGIPVFAGLLVICDILLIELSLVAVLQPVKALLPKNLNKLLGVHNAIKSLQKWHVLPNPERVEIVLVSSVLAGIIELAVLLAAGAFW